MNTANWLTLAASVVAFLSVLVALYSVILTHRSNCRQLDQTNALALQQIRASAEETSKKLRADILLKEKQAWIAEFRNTVNDIIYLGDPDLDAVTKITLGERNRELIKLAHKIDLLMPVGQTHKDLCDCIVVLSTHLKSGAADPMVAERLKNISNMVILARRIISEELKKIESSL